MSLLKSVVKTAPQLPSRVYLYAQEKWGKTSWAAYAPNPLYIMSEGETGLLSLLEAGRIPETAHFPEDAKSWEQLLGYVRAVRDEAHDHKTLVIDTSNGCERLLSQFVCDKEFGGVMTGRDGYGSYGKGDLSCVSHWVGFLRLLDEIRVRRRMSIILLAHSKIKAVNNPEGSDYDQLRPEGIDKLWTLTHKWADVIAAGTHDVFVKDDKVKNTKGRVIRTSGSVAVVAGNRYGLPEQIPCGASAQSAWTAFAKAMQAAKAAGKKPEPPKSEGNGGQPTATPQPPTSPVPAPAAPKPDEEIIRSDAPHIDPRGPLPAGYVFEDEGEITDPDPQATAKELPGAICSRLIEKIVKKGYDWPMVRDRLSDILGRDMGDNTRVIDLTIDEAVALESWVDSQPKYKAPAKAKEKVLA